MTKEFDLLQTVEYGGCSAKIPAGELSALLSKIPIPTCENIIVDISTHDDAGVYKLDDERALIVTTDFFPPICSDAYEFGEIAAANSLSDVYAMGGKPLLALNLNMFPAKRFPLEVLRDIIAGGQSKINEAKAFTMGGHTIDDETPKYGLAVVGEVHPDKVISNDKAIGGQVLILTKALGSGVLVAAQRMKLANHDAYREAIEQMKLLNDKGAEVMQKYDVKCATDVTGFGLMGHLMKLSDASGVSVELDCQNIPTLPQVMDLLESGCIPGAAFKNLEFTKDNILINSNVTTELKMLLCDAQTSGGLLMCVDEAKADAALADLLKDDKYPYSRIIGKIIPKTNKAIILK
ncbi:MAG: selenide, water dikinase SelD [Rikenellaceae bacterium]